jgi:hypothetical protein
MIQCDRYVSSLRCHRQATHFYMDKEDNQLIARCTLHKVRIIKSNELISWLAKLTEAEYLVATIHES